MVIRYGVWAAGSEQGGVSVSYTVNGVLFQKLRVREGLNGEGTWA